MRLNQQYAASSVRATQRAQGWPTGVAGEVTSRLMPRHVSNMI